MKYFYAIMEQEGDSAYGITFPDLPGCFSAADRVEDVLPNASQALELWFDDQDEVEPSRLDQVREVAAEALAAGGTLIAVPFIENDHKVMRVNLSLERGILNAIDDAARDRRLTRSSFLAQAARNEITGANR